MARFNFAAEIWGWTRLILDDKGEPQGMKRGGQVLTGCDLSLFVIGSSCDQDGGGMLPLQIITLALPPKKKQSETGMLGALLKQSVDELKGVPGETT